MPQLLSEVYSNTLVETESDTLVFPYASGNTQIRINCEFILKQYLVILWGDTSLAFQFFEAFKLYSIYIVFSLFRKAFAYGLGFFTA